MDENVELQNITMAYLTRISKNLPAAAGDQSWSLGHKDPCMELQSPQYFGLENPWTETPGGLQSVGPRVFDMTELLTHTS